MVGSELSTSSTKLVKCQNTSAAAVNISLFKVQAEKNIFMENFYGILRFISIETLALYTKSKSEQRNKSLSGEFASSSSKLTLMRVGLSGDEV